MEDKLVAAITEVLEQTGVGRTEDAGRVTEALLKSDAFRDWISQRLVDTWENAEWDETDQANAIVGRPLFGKAARASKAIN